MFARTVSLILLLAAMLPCLAHAHDPSAWGGLFRSRDMGATWFPSDAGLFIGGALGVAVHPQDANHLIYGSDTRLLRSRNGGRDWTAEAATAMPGAIFAVAFNADGKGALASTGTRIFYSDDGAAWQDAMAPGGAAPARAFARGSSAERIYMGGARGLFVSDNRGREWTRAGEGVLPDTMPVLALVVVPGTPDLVYAVIEGRIWASSDGAVTWRTLAAGLPEGRVETLAEDPQRRTRLWGVAANQVFTSDDAGASWKAQGRPLPDPDTSVRGLASSGDGKILVLSTHRGVLRSTDGGQSWGQVESTLPVHLEAGPLLRDPHDASTLYAGFSLSPYGEMYRRAEQGGALLTQIDPLSLAGGVAFLLLLIASGIFATRWLSRRYGGGGVRPRFR